MGKKWDRFQHLDEDEYWREVCEMSEDQLRREHKILQQNMVSAAAAGGASVAAGFFTFGVAWAGTAIAARRLNVNSRQCDLVEKRLKEMGWNGHKFRKRDFALAAGPCAVAEMVIPAGGALLGHAGQVAAHHTATAIGQHAAIAAKQHAVSNTVQHAAKDLVTQKPAEAVASVVTHSSTFAHAAAQGAENEISRVTFGLVGHATQATQFIPVDVATSQATVLGSTAGNLVAHEGTQKLASFAVQQATKAVVTKVAMKDDDKIPAISAPTIIGQETVAVEVVSTSYVCRLCACSFTSAGYLDDHTSSAHKDDKKPSQIPP